MGLFSFSRDEFSGLLQKEGFKEDLFLTALNSVSALSSLSVSVSTSHISARPVPLYMLSTSCLPLLFPDKNSLVFCLWET